MTANLKFLTEIPFGLPGKIYRSPMPFGPYDRQNQVWPLYQENHVRGVVVLVEKQEFLAHAHRDLLAFYRSTGLDIIHFPIPDFQVPKNDGLMAAIEDVITQAQDGNNIAVHCLAGIGRTGIFIACMAKQQQKVNGQASIRWVRQFIPGALENLDQEKFVKNF